MINNKSASKKPAIKTRCSAIPMIIESLEDRRLLSGGHHFGRFGGAFGYGQNVNTIEFSQAPAAVQTGLDTLATTDGLTAPTSDSTQTVFLGNSRGVETFTLDITSTGTDTKLTVDQNGNPVTAPTKSTTDWATLNGSAAGSDTAAAAEISAIATALNLTSPADTDTVNVVTTNGASTYSIHVASSTGHRGRTVTVDQNGNPVGNQNLPFSVLPTTIQDGLNTNRPAGADALDAASTQIVNVRTIDGVTRYSTTFTVTGTTTTVTVDSTGALTKVPTTTTDQFQNIPAAAQTELQALATNNGVTTTISATQTVKVYDEANGVTVYAVTLPATMADNGGNSFTVMITVASDQLGNPTTPPTETLGGGEGGRGRFGGGCDVASGTDDSDDSSSSSSSSSSTSSASTTDASTTSTSTGFGFGFRHWFRRWG